MENGSRPKVALVIGATGIQGRHLTRYLDAQNEWSVVAVSRRPLDYKGKNVRHLSVDLMKPEDLDHHKEALSKVTHIFFTAWTTTGDEVKDCEVNLAMLRNPVEAIERAGAPLLSVYCTTGSKWYGMQLPYCKTPFREDDPRHLPPNFYYDEQDYLERRVAEGAGWTWSSLRPGPILGYSHGSLMNLLVDVAVYAVVCKELGLPLRWPGSEVAYNSVCECVDVEMLVEAEVFVATHKHTQNQAFNINNGDTFRWNQLWPKLAKFFNMEVGPRMPMSLVKYMADKQGLWEQITKKYNLQTEYPWDKLTTWEFMDFNMHQACDWFSNTNKLRRAGFTKMCIDTDEMYMRQLEGLEEEKIIPKYN